MKQDSGALPFSGVLKEDKGEYGKMFVGGEEKHYAVYFEDPDRIKVELVAWGE